METSKKREESALEGFLAVFIGITSFIIIPGLTIIACLGVLGWQIFPYYRHGVWQSISAIDALSLIFQNTNFGLWLVEKPESWYGVYQITNWLPLWLGVAIKREKTKTHANGEARK